MRKSEARALVATALLAAKKGETIFISEEVDRHGDYTVAEIKKIGRGRYEYSTYTLLLCRGGHYLKANVELLDGSISLEDAAYYAIQDVGREFSIS